MPSEATVAAPRRRAAPPAPAAPATIRARDPREGFYDTIADDFDAVMNGYDVARRIEIVFDELLAGVSLSGLRLLDAGCGTGRFSAAACRRGARVVALDLGARLLGRVRARCAARPVCGDVLSLAFADDSFDVVVSSECIEHTPRPGQAVMELLRVCRPGGWLALTCPNYSWRWACTLAMHTGLRPYAGLENWPRFGELARWVALAGGRVRLHFGFHLLPFVFGRFNGLLRSLDRLGGRAGRLFVNQAVLAQKIA
ncbi:MAG: methyltransferase domain-containing protein [Phycisphaerae bacterium]